MKWDYQLIDMSSKSTTFEEVFQDHPWGICCWQESWSSCHDWRYLYQLAVGNFFIHDFSRANNELTLCPQYRQTLIYKIEIYTKSFTLGQKRYNWLPLVRKDTRENWSLWILELFWRQQPSGAKLMEPLGILLSDETIQYIQILPWPTDYDPILKTPKAQAQIMLDQPTPG